MLKIRLFLLFITLTIFGASEANAQLFKRKKKKTNVSGLVIEEAPDLEKQERQLQRRLVNPVRKNLNRFNFSIEKGVGYFSYQNPLTDVSVIRDPSGSQLYIVPLGEEEGLTSPINAFDNWFSDLTPVGIQRIDDDSHIVRTDTTDFLYKNNGRINPLTLRFSLSLKKIDKGHYERTKEKIYLEDDLLRIGGGIGFGALNFRNPASTQGVSDRLGNFTLPSTKLSTTKLFASLSYNMYTLGDYSIHADVLGGVWKVKAKQVNKEVVNYDPFFNIGIMFQMKFTKYFKGYIRPSFEMRSYTVSNELINIQHKFSVFSLDIGLLFKYPIYPRNKYKADQVQMEHIFNNKIYRGRPFYRKQNPRFGQRRIRRKPSGN